MRTESNDAILLPVASQIFRKLVSLELEEKILNCGAFVALLGVFLPWIGGEQLGGELVSFSGFGFYTTVIGIAVFGLELFVLLITLVPLTGGPPLVRKRSRELVRLLLTGQATILILAALSVLIRVTIVDLRRMEIRFGIYVALIGALVALFEAFLRFQEQRRSAVQELFHHPEQSERTTGKEEFYEAPPPPPPPPPPQPEEHRMYR